MKIKPFLKAVTDLVIIIFLLGIATEWITPSFYKIMIVLLIPGLVVTIIYIIEQLSRR